MSNPEFPAIIWYRAVSTITRILGGAMIGIVLLFLITLVIPEGDTNHSYIRSMLALEETIGSFVRDNVPAKIAGTDLTRWVIIIGAFMMGTGFNTVSNRAHERSEYYIYKHNVDELRAQMNLPENSIILSQLNNQLEQLKTAKKKERAQLLKEFMETKKKLEEWMKS